jgi:hypothetical protein
MLNPLKFSRTKIVEGILIYLKLYLHKNKHFHQKKRASQRENSLIRE